MPQTTTQKAISLFTKGLELHQLGALEDAKRYYLDALKTDPRFFEAQHLLGVIFAQQNQLDTAVLLISKALDIRIDEGALTNRGLALHQLMQYEAALQDFNRAIALNPNNPQSHYNHGNTLQELQQYEAALQSYDQAIAIDPNCAEFYNNRGNTLQELKQYEAALQSYDQAIAIDPNNADAYYNRGNTLQELKQYEAALQSYDQAIAIDPNNAEAFNGRGDCLYELGQIDVARDNYHRAIQINKNFTEARLGAVASRVPKVWSANLSSENLRNELFHELIDLETWLRPPYPKESFRAVGRHQLYYLAYQDANNLEILKKYGQISQCLMSSYNHSPLQNLNHEDHSDEKIIRVGIISSHIHVHSVWEAITKGIVENIDKNLFELHLIHLGKFEDNETKQAKKLAKTFNSNIESLNDAIALIKKYAFDVLLYPEIGMHQLTTQLANLRLAPHQIASWGHPETTGLPTIDYFLSADLIEDNCSKNYYSERLIKLPNLGVFYKPYDGLACEPNFKALGIEENKPIFICPGSPFKYQPNSDSVFVEIAKRIPECQFIFFNFDDNLTAILKARLEQSFSQAGLNGSEFIRFIPFLNKENFRGLLSKADVYLDTIGFSGFNTALQAIEQDLPIVTIEGKFMRGRLGSGILRRIGLDWLIAKDQDDYVDLVQRLITDPAFNLKAREQMAERKMLLFMDKSPIIALQEFLVSLCKPATLNKT